MTIRGRFSPSPFPRTARYWPPGALGPTTRAPKSPSGTPTERGRTRNPNQRRHRRLLRQFRVAIKVFVNVSGATGRQFIELFRRNVRGQCGKLLPNGQPRALEDDTAVLDFGHQLGPWLNAGLAAEFGGQEDRAAGVRFHERGHDWPPR